MIVTSPFCLRIAFRVLALPLVLLLSLAPAQAQPPTKPPAEPPAEPASSPATTVAPGHSYHGETFNEGARQAATIMDGLAKISFETAAKHKQAQAFVEQGIAQLHGFWYLEAERSFRQAAAIEPELAIAYWGCACANINNRKRAKGFIEEAMKRAKAPTTRREKMYIEALDRYLKADDEKPASEKQNDDEETNETKRKAQQRYIADLEKIIDEFPNDIEAKAFLVLQLWLADGDGLKMPSRYATDALLNGIFAVQPMHPAHHYRIHLWDNARPKNALDSAAKAGPSMPAVAHMWHMPGHTYSKLNRYADAVWQQEASARVDHAFMTKARIMPDQIHNFAHNNEWMIRNLLFLGRVEDAVRHAKHLISLPRHPQYNTYDKGSARFGRERLLQALTSYSLWKRLIDEATGPYLMDTGIEELDQERDAWLAVAHAMEGNKQEAALRLIKLRREKLKWETKLLDNASATASGKGDQESTKSTKAARDQIKRLQALISRVAAASAAVRKDKASLEQHAKTAKLDLLTRAEWLAIAGEFEAAHKLAEQAVKENRGQVRPLALLVDLLWKRDKKPDAVKRFDELRRLAHDADLELPMLSALSPVASEAKVAGDWRIARKLPGDLGERPAWDTLGPEYWQPYAAPSIDVESPDDLRVDNDASRNKPRLVFFYLGFGCLHCVEQLKAFAPQAEAFRELGIELAAVSNEDLDKLRTGIEQFDAKLPFPLFSDPDQNAFKAYRCWDDFESLPLHGTFLIDGKGRVRWQDIGSEPFNDPEFLLVEAKRLLALPDLIATPRSEPAAKE